MSERTIRVTSEVVIMIPSRPNFIQVGNQTINTADIDSVTLEKIGQSWTKALIEEARAKENIK